MRAAWYSRNGEAREVLIVGEMPIPEPGRGEVRVRIACSGVNPSDVKSRRNRPLASERIVPHSDGAGVIDMVGEGVNPDRIGERVWVWNGQWQRPMGTAAQYAVLPELQAVELPAAVEFAAAACLGIPATTAFQAIHMLGDIAGKTVLVVGASSAVGHYATQFAAMGGAKVIGTVGSVEKARHAVNAGAAETIYYKEENVPERVKAITRGLGVHAIVDMDFSTTIKWLPFGVLAPHGTIICYGSNAPGETAVPFRDLLFGSISLRFFVVYDLDRVDRQRATDGLTRLLEEGKLQHTIGARFPLDDIAAAHEAVEAGSLIGNVVLDLP
jgi:NADPH2:quinone reductase